MPIKVITGSSVQHASLVVILLLSSFVFSHRFIQRRPSTIIPVAQDASTSWLFVVGVPGQQPENLSRAWGGEPG